MGVHFMSGLLLAMERCGWCGKGGQGLQVSYFEGIVHYIGNRHTCLVVKGWI